MNINIIAALSKNYAIGNKGRLLWNLPVDLKRFKALTMGKPIIMGRKTHESIGRPLPGRKNIVMSRSKNFKIPGVNTADSLESALALAKPANEVFIIGGAQIYKLALPYAKRLFLTWVEGEYEADTFFPKLNLDNWQLVRSERHETDSPSQIIFTFSDYIRL